MSTTDFWVWTPRVLGTLTSLFIGLFALDAFSAGKPLAAALPDFFIHLIPAIVLLALVAVSFRRPWIGGAAFIGLGVFYALAMARGRVDWIIVISGPLMIVGLLFLWSSLRGHHVHA